MLTTVLWGTQTFLHDDATEEQRDKVLTQCAEAGSWRSEMESRLAPQTNPKTISVNTEACCLSFHEEVIRIPVTKEYVKAKSRQSYV